VICNLYIRECASSNCPTLQNGRQYCRNMALQSRSFPTMEICFTPQCGHGLRVTDNVAAGTVILEYTGEVIDLAECEMRRRSLKASDHFYLASLCAGVALDAKRFGSKARFANHSCNPNCELQKWTIQGQPVLALVSIKDLKPFEQLTYNYQYYEDGLDKLNGTIRQTCRCGEKNCSGIIGGRVNRSVSDKWTQKALTVIEGQRTLHLDVVKDLISAADDSQKDIVDQLTIIVKIIENWVKTRAQPLLQSTNLVTKELLSVIISEYPHSSVKCDSLNELWRIEKSVARLEKKLQHSAKSSSSASQESSTAHHHAKLNWESFILIVKDAAACLPVCCDGLKDILTQYEPCDRWACQVIKALGKSLIQEDWQPSGRSSAQWGALSRVAEYYCVKVTWSTLKLESCLDGRLSLYINRAQWLQQSRGLDEYDKRGVSANSELPPDVLRDIYAENIQLGVNDLTIEKKNAESSIQSSPQSEAAVKSEEVPVDTSKARVELHCVCRLPSDDSESPVWVQCDSCNGWFHPFCINRGHTAAKSSCSRSSTAKKDKCKKKINEESTIRSGFECPFCTFDDSKPCAFAFPVSFEWHDNFFKHSKIEVSDFISRSFDDKLSLSSPESRIRADIAQQTIGNDNLYKGPMTPTFLKKLVSAGELLPLSEVSLRIFHFS
jgi:hypothetical protein